MNSHCEALSSPNIPNFTISILLVVGILLSYLPQHFRIISRRSSEGLSPSFILLGTTSATCALANILVLPTSLEDVACCKEISSFACTASLLGIAQIGMQWCCFTIITLLFLSFFPKFPKSQNLRHEGEPSTPTLNDALFVVYLSMAHFFVILIISIVVFARFFDYLQSWANLLGTFSTILASIQYLPQIWTTWRLQQVLSLSIPMMCIQTPGSYLFAASLAIRLGWPGWSAWGVYIVTGLLQGCLLIMAVAFELRDRKVRLKSTDDARTNGNITRRDDGPGDVQNEERRPLLQ